MRTAAFIPGDRKFRHLWKAHLVGDAHQATESSDFFQCSFRWRCRQKVPPSVQGLSRWRRPGDRTFRLLYAAHHAGDAHKATESSDFCLELITLATPTRRHKVPIFVPKLITLATPAESSDSFSKLITSATPTRRHKVPNFV